MKGTAYNLPTEWLDFDDPVDPDQAWRVHVNFLMSNWRCLFGDGCAGPFGKDELHTNPELGCCAHGVHIEDAKELERVEARVSELTAADLAPEALKYIEKHGWFVRYKDVDGEPHVKTRIRNGGCVFINRSNEGDGKIGCAFHHLGERTGRPSHVDTMPDACWQLPIGSRSIEVNGLVTTTIEAWDADYWQGEDEDGTHDSWLSWWCVDTPDAYTGGERFYRSYEQELRALMGNPAYDLMCDLLKKREGNVIEPMAGAVRNEGRPMLPLLIGDRTPRNGGPRVRST